MDSSARIVTSLQRAADDLGFPVPDSGEARHVIGLNLHDSLLRLFGQVSDKQVNAYIERYRYHFYHPDASQMLMFDGVMEGLEAMDRCGLLLAVATGKGRQGLNPILKEYKMEDFFVMTRCADEAFGKPHPQMLSDILDFTGLDASRAVMVGDTSYDLEMAENAAMHAIAVDYGAHHIDDLRQYNPQACFSDFTHLTEWLLNKA